LQSKDNGRGIPKGEKNNSSSHNRSSNIALSTNPSIVSTVSTVNPVIEQPQSKSFVESRVPDDISKRSLIIKNESFRFSIQISPQSDMLLKRMWIRKRGTFVRNWNNRFFVLEKSTLKYYTEESSDPPYGKNLKGQLSLMGAVLSLRHVSNSSVHIELVGTKGEKELLLEMDLSNASLVLFLLLLFI
jgi:hypothetical protein